MEYINESLEIKNKLRQLHYCYDLNLYKRRRTFSGIRCLDKWKILNGYIDLNKKLNCLEVGSHEGQSSTYFLKRAVELIQQPLEIIQSCQLRRYRDFSVFSPLYTPNNVACNINCNVFRSCSYDCSA